MQHVESMDGIGTTYYGRVEFVDGLPFLLPRLHYVDLLVYKRSVQPYLLDDCFCCVAQRAIRPCEEGDARVPQARCSTQHGSASLMRQNNGTW